MPAGFQHSSLELVCPCGEKRFWMVDGPFAEAREAAEAEGWDVNSANCPACKTS